MFNNLFIDWSSDVIIVEGAFDAIRVGSNAIPILGSTLREDSELFKKIVLNDASVFIALDPDAEKKSLEIIYKLLTYDVELYKIEVGPYTDVGEMPREVFIKRKRDAKRMNIDEYIIHQANNI